MPGTPGIATFERVASERTAAEAKVSEARAALREAEAWLERVRQAEFDARDAAFFAEAKATGDMSKLPRCEYLEDWDAESISPGKCERIATRSGGCEAFYVCDAHKCRHKCPELPWAAMVREKAL